MFEFKHPNYYAKIKKENRLTNKENYDKGIDNEKIQNNIAYYLNHNLMKIEANDFYATDRYFITYEEISI